MVSRHRLFFIASFLTLAFLVSPQSAKAVDDPTYQWTKAVGGTGSDWGNSIVKDTEGNIYLTGPFQNTVDFDPSGSTDNKTSAGSFDIFLSKYSSDGTYQWTKAVGGAGTDIGSGVVVDASGNLYLTGYYQNTVDFDPSGGTDNRTSAGSQDIFLSKYSADGTYQWTKAVGGTGADFAYRVGLDAESDLHIVGYFQNTVDFDPTGATDNRTSAGSYDIFLSKYSSNGTYQWTKAVGGAGSDYGYGVTVAPDGRISISGSFYSSTVDFDPSSGTDTHTENGSGEGDVFFSTYADDGTYLWTHTIGGDGYDDSYSNLVSDTEGNLYISGAFDLTVDFDLTSGVDERISNGTLYNSDAFITSYDRDGGYRWTKTWGGSGFDDINSLFLYEDTLSVAGSYQGTADFDPGAEIDQHTSNGGIDIYFSAYSLPSDSEAVSLLTSDLTLNRKDVTRSKFYTSHKSLTLRGTTDAATTGKLYIENSKGGDKRLKTFDIPEDGAWSVKIPGKSDGTDKYTLKFYDEDGNHLGIDKSFTLVRDLTPPAFTSLPNFLTKPRGGTITFAATDDQTEVKAYKVRLTPGRKDWRKQKEDFYTLPQDIGPGLYRFQVRAEDKGGNERVKTVIVLVR